MSKQPRLTQHATADIDQAAEYLEARSPEAAERVILRIQERAHFLAKFPRTGRARDDLRPGLRSAAVPPYVIFFRDFEDTIEVVRVLHGAQDTETAFAEEEE